MCSIRIISRTFSKPGPKKDDNPVFNLLDEKERKRLLEKKLEKQMKKIQKQMEKEKQRIETRKREKAEKKKQKQEGVLGKFY